MKMNRIEAIKTIAYEFHRDAQPVANGYKPIKAACKALGLTDEEMYHTLVWLGFGRLTKNDPELVEFVRANSPSMF